MLWDYEIVGSDRNPDTLVMLKTLGKKEWELVGVGPNGDLYLRRPLIPGALTDEEKDQIVAAELGLAHQPLDVDTILERVRRRMEEAESKLRKALSPDGDTPDALNALDAINKIARIASIRGGRKPPTDILGQSEVDPQPYRTHYGSVPSGEEDFHDDSAVGD